METRFSDTSVLSTFSHSAQASVIRSPKSLFPPGIIVLNPSLKYVMHGGPNWQKHNLKSFFAFIPNKYESLRSLEQSVRKIPLNQCFLSWAKCNEKIHYSYCFLGWAFEITCQVSNALPFSTERRIHRGAIHANFFDFPSLVQLKNDRSSLKHWQEKPCMSISNWESWSFLRAN